MIKTSIKVNSKVNEIVKNQFNTQGVFFCEQKWDLLPQPPARKKSKELLQSSCHYIDSTVYLGKCWKN